MDYINFPQAMVLIQQGKTVTRKDFYQYFEEGQPLWTITYDGKDYQITNEHGEHLKPIRLLDPEHPLMWYEIDQAIWATTDALQFLQVPDGE
jgi:hypothetical protein